MIQRGDAIVPFAVPDCAQDLALAHWMYSTNEMVYSAGLIPQHTYEYAESVLQESIDKLSGLWYTTEEVGNTYGFTED